MNSQMRQKIDEFFAKYHLQQVDKDQILIHSGEDPPGIFLLVDGQIRQYDITRKGEEVVVNVYKPPACFPVAWAINNEPNLYFYESVGKSVIRLAPAKDVLAFLKANPDVVYNLLRRAYSGEHGLLRRMAFMMGGNGHSRVLYELINECKQFGIHQKDGSYRLDLHEDELAHRAGLTRETVSRELSKLKKHGLLTIGHRSIIVHDLPFLEHRLETL